MTKKHKSILSILMALVLLVTGTVSFPFDSTAKAYDTQESAVSTPNSSENLSAQIENIEPLAIEKSGFMERIDEFPFVFEIISTDGEYVTAHLHIDIYDEYLEQYVDPEIIFGLCSAH